MSILRVAVVASATVVLALPGAARAQAQAQQTPADAYYDFLMARHLEAAGDTKGAESLLQRAVAADPKSAEGRGELAAFYLRRDDGDNAERVVKEALQLDDKNSE